MSTTPLHQLFIQQHSVNIWKLRRSTPVNLNGMFSILVWFRISAVQQFSLFCNTLNVLIHQIVQWVAGWDCRQSNLAQRFLLWSHTVVRAECGLSVMLKLARLFPGKDVVYLAAYVAPSLYTQHPSALLVPWLPVPYALMNPYFGSDLLVHIVMSLQNRVCFQCSAVWGLKIMTIQNCFSVLYLAHRILPTNQNNISLPAPIFYQNYCCRGWMEDRFSYGKS